MISSKKTDPVPAPIPLMHYPTLRKATETPKDPFVVLFTSLYRGVVVWSENESRPVGYYNESWMPADDSSWEPFEGSITLSNA